jgi:pantoate--beta-alanine ligase
MKIVRMVADLKHEISKASNSGKKISFVPTMGAIHLGHVSLIEIAKSNSDFVVASIFVNPLQFDSVTDLEQYPNHEAADIKALESSGTDLLFMPTVQEIYPNGEAVVTQSAGLVGSLFEGKSRKGHFDGMLTVVSRLFDLVQPNVAIFGAKDAQQLFLVKQMVREQISSGLREPIEIIEAPTVREPSGLALSSRNERLSAPDQTKALALSKALELVASNVELGAGVALAHRLASSVFSATPEAKLDYLAFVNPETFEPVSDGFTGQALMIVAAEVGGVRLIDNGLVTL